MLIQFIFDKSYVLLLRLNSKHHCHHYNNTNNMLHSFLHVSCQAVP